MYTFQWEICCVLDNFDDIQSFSVITSERREYKREDNKWQLLIMIYIEIEYAVEINREVEKYITIRYILNKHEFIYETVNYIDLNTVPEPHII